MPGEREFQELQIALARHASQISALEQERRRAEERVRRLEQRLRGGTPLGEADRYATGHVRLNANPADGDTVTVGTDAGSTTYEFDNDATVGAGNVSVTIGAAAADTAANLQAAIDANQGSVLASAVHGTDTTTVDLRCNAAGDALTVSGTGAAVFTQDNAEEQVAVGRVTYALTRTVTGEDGFRGRVRVDTGLGSIDVYAFRFRTSSADNSEVAWTGTVTISGGVIEFPMSGLVSGNILHLIVLGEP